MQDHIIEIEQYQPERVTKRAARTYNKEEIAAVLEKHLSDNPTLLQRILKDFPAYSTQRKYVILPATRQRYTMDELYEMVSHLPDNHESGEILAQASELFHSMPGEQVLWYARFCDARLQKLHAEPTAMVLCDAKAALAQQMIGHGSQYPFFRTETTEHIQLSFYRDDHQKISVQIESKEDWNQAREHNALRVACDTVEEFYQLDESFLDHAIAITKASPEEELDEPSYTR